LNVGNPTRGIPLLELLPGHEQDPFMEYRNWIFYCDMRKTWTSSIARIWGKVLLLSFTGNIQYCSWNCCLCFVHRPANGWLCIQQFVSVIEIHFVLWLQLFIHWQNSVVDKLRIWVLCDVMSSLWVSGFQRCEGVPSSSGSSR